MSTEPLSPNQESSEDLAAISDLQDYGAMIVSELDKAEANLDNSDNQPFSGMSADIMRDIVHLRNRQFDMFRRHVEIEQGYKIHSTISDGNDVERMTFSGIATTMRKKESATAGLLNRLADFDAQLRTTMDKFETSGGGAPTSTAQPQSAPDQPATDATPPSPPTPPTPTARSRSQSTQTTLPPASTMPSASPPPLAGALTHSRSE